MFGIGGGEFFFIILVVLMLFGSDKVPEIARALGKGMQQLKNATNDIKGEIQKSAQLDDVKKTFTDIKTDITKDIPSEDISKNVKEEINKMKEDIEDMSGPIKRLK